MALKTFKPTTPSQRQLVLIDRTNLWKGKPVKALTVGKSSTGGRNNHGHITGRHMGGGHKRRLRIIDFKRRKFDVPATVERLEYDPNRSAFIALIKYADGELSYILAPQRLKAGDEVVAGERVDIKPGNAMPLGNMPVGTIVHNVEMKKGRGGQLARSAGTYVQLVGKEKITSALRTTLDDTGASDRRRSRLRLRRGSLYQLDAGRRSASFFVNALLDAYQITRDEFYASVARETLAYVLRDMIGKEGGFYSAEDAESAEDAQKPEEKGEGAFYVWTKDEIDRSLGKARARRRPRIAPGPPCIESAGRRSLRSGRGHRRGDGAQGHIAVIEPRYCAAGCSPSPWRAAMYLLWQPSQTS